MLCEKEDNGEAFTSNHAHVAPVEIRHRMFLADGWMPLLRGAFKQHMNRWRGPRRNEKTVLIPHAVIDNLAKRAKEAGLRVTRHDLLMAWIYEFSTRDIGSVGKLH